jgi:hypothetical protein
MDALADHLTTLEGYTDLEPEIIRDTKANKLLKVILKLATIPRDEEFKFKQRCKVLLDTWTKVLQSDEEKGVKVNGGSAINGVDKDKKDGVKLGTTAGEEPTPSVETETTPAANGHGDKDAPLESVETAPGKLEADAPAVVKEGVSAPA